MLLLRVEVIFTSTLNSALNASFGKWVWWVDAVFSVGWLRWQLFLSGDTGKFLGCRWFCIPTDPVFPSCRSKDKPLKISDDPLIPAGVVILRAPTDLVR